MSDQSPAPEITKRMKRLLQEVQKHAFPLKEKTLFSIEGIIGRLENPTTELLRFFMAPDGGHDLGPLFLRAFFTCLEKDCSKHRFDGVRARPQDPTDDRKFIDMLIWGLDWVLLIENKIGAPINNPLDSYEKYAKRYFPGRELHLAILSPSGQTDPKFPQWKAVSYQDYCNALKSEFTKTVFDHPISKWQVFAREFIVHLENKLSNPAMTLKPEQTNFVEANLREIRDVKKLSDCYTAHLRRELSERLQKELPLAREFQFHEENDRGLFCDKHIGQSHLQFLFQTPAHGWANSKGDFVISAWVGNLTEAQRQRAAELLARPDVEYDEHGHWVGTVRFDTRKEAVNALCKLAKELFDLWENEPPASTA
jgi:hypothetical protein